MKMEYVIYKRHPSSMKQKILSLCEQVFGTFNSSYLLTRLPKIVDPVLILAKRNREVVGFKLGYRRSSTLFYSWLGGVLPAERCHGVATELMATQHGRLLELGYRFVETHTRASNNAMIILNLRHGFEIVGVENSSDGHLIVSQRKSLERG